jgi:hypothetical protein
MLDQIWADLEVVDSILEVGHWIAAVARPYLPARQHLVGLVGVVHIVEEAVSPQEDTGQDFEEDTVLDCWAAVHPNFEAHLLWEVGHIAAVEGRPDQAHWTADSCPLAAGSSLAALLGSAFHVDDRVTRCSLLKRRAISSSVRPRALILKLKIRRRLPCRSQLPTETPTMEQRQSKESQIKEKIIKVKYHQAANSTS